MLLLVVACCCVQLNAVEAATLVDQVAELLPRHVGAAVLAVDDGKTIFKHAWGKRHLHAPEPCTTATNFRLASVTKHMTATAVMLLVERGRVELGDTR